MKKFFEKLKKLTQKTTKNQSESDKLDTAPVDDKADKVALMAHLHPISARIQAWLDEHDWRYYHVKPEADDILRTHLFILGFSHDGFDWRCIIRIYEKNQLVCLFGTLEDAVPKSHRLAVLVALSQASLNIGFGGFELDLDSGEVRTKLSLDAEFSQLNSHALDIYLYNLTGLVERMGELVEKVVDKPASPMQDDFLAQLQLLNIDGEDGVDDGFFVPTQSSQ